MQIEVTFESVFGVSQEEFAKRVPRGYELTGEIVIARSLPAKQMVCVRTGCLYYADEIEHGNLVAVVRKGPATKTLTVEVPANVNAADVVCLYPTGEVRAPKAGEAYRTSRGDFSHAECNYSQVRFPIFAKAEAKES